MLQQSLQVLSVSPMGMDSTCMKYLASYYQSRQKAQELENQFGRSDPINQTAKTMVVTNLRNAASVCSQMAAAACGVVAQDSGAGEICRALRTP